MVDVGRVERGRQRYAQELVDEDGDVDGVCEAVKVEIAGKADAAIVPTLLDKIEESKPQGGGDDRIGLVLIALGAALFGLGLIQGDPDDIRNLSGLALFPTFVGAVLAGRYWILRRRGENL